MKGPRDKRPDWKRRFDDPQADRQRKVFCDVSNGPGIYVQANLSTLISEIRAGSGARDDQQAKIEALMRAVGLRPSSRSTLDAKRDKVSPG